MQAGWQIRHERHGWGDVVNPGVNGQGITARFADCEVRHVRYKAIKECKPPRGSVPAPLPPVAEPSRRELQERKAAVMALLVEGREADANTAFRKGHFPNHFWSEATYQKNKEDQRKAFRNQIRESAEKGDVEKAQDLRQSHCSQWMTDDDFRECVHQGLVNGSQWDKLSELAGADEVKKHLVPSLLRRMLAVDIESDGEDIWEIGIATAHDKHVLLSRHDHVNQTPRVLGALTARIGQAHILVGHNFLAWDWPILLPRIAVEHEPLIWDTLLVQFLLEPQAPTHALGSSHFADEDAKASADLFEQQLRRLPVCIAMKLMDEAFASTVELLEAIAQALLNESRPAKVMPTWFPRDLQEPHTIVMVPEHRLRELDWVPAVTVVPTDVESGLAVPWRQIDPAQLEQALADEGIRGYRTSLVLTIAQLAAAQGVALRRNMLPAWLVDGDARLEAAVTRSSVMPDGNEGLRVAPMPTSTRWWTNADPSTYILAGISDDVLVLDREQVASNAFVGGQQLLAHPAFARVDDQESMPHWLVQDRGMHVLEPEGGWSRFSTWQIPTAAAKLIRDVPGPHQRPALVTRQRPVLFPRAEDQASYWQDVLAAVRELAVQDRHVVPILLIGSSHSCALQELIATGLAELHLGELKPEHRSRREHLLRASRNHHVLVDTLDQWPAWQALAATTGVVLQPVVEALPIEEWFASDATRAQAPGTGNKANPAASKFAGKPAEIEGDVLLGRLYELTSSRLHGWLYDAGLSTAMVQVVLIDPRLSAISRELRAHVDFRPLQDQPLADEESRRLAVVLAPLTVKREEAPNTLEAMEAFLVAHWQPKDQHAGNQVVGFKPTQRQAMELICQRTTHVLVSLPTGEGKSVLFQVPALCRGLRNRRLTLVISPLKALMRDQVERLRDQGFAESADYLSGDRPWHEAMEVIQGVLDHRIVLLYVAPERLRSEAFVQVLAKRMLSDGGLEHVVVDEAHCVNQWGFEFRPDYFHAMTQLLFMCRALDVAGNPTIFTLLSATITASDRARLQSILSEANAGCNKVLPLSFCPQEFFNPIRTHIEVDPKKVQGKLADREEFENALAERLPFITEAIGDARSNREKTGQRSAVLVFVGSRKHAEILAARLAAEVGGAIDYFHAGLDATTREEIYARFRDSDLDVLVATKAFGMGMDIPDIHWVVHLSPPSYLEDYLQEVGRIGRGVRERERAGLQQLPALLFCSDRDFESIRSMRARSALSLPVIKDFLRDIEMRARGAGGARLSIIHSEGLGTSLKPQFKTATSARAAATRVRMALYWLERAGRLRLCGSIADLIEVSVNTHKMRRVAEESGPMQEIARLLLKIQSDEHEYQPDEVIPDHDDLNEAVVARPAGDRRGQGDSLLGGFFRSVGRILGRLLGLGGLTLDAASPEPANDEPVPAPRRVQAAPRQQKSPSTNIVLNLAQVALSCTGLRSTGDVLTCLTDLESLGALKLNNEVRIESGALKGEPEPVIERLFETVDGAVKGLLRKLGDDGRLEFHPSDFLEESKPEIVIDAGKREHYERAFINGFRTLARSSGVRLRQLVRDDEKVIWEAILPQAARARADAYRARIVRGAKSLQEATRGRDSIPITQLIEGVRSVAVGRRFRDADFRKAATLLSSMKLTKIARDLLPLSHVVELLDAEDALESRTDVWDELARVNDLAEARNLAMEVFANLGKDAREAFVPGYFAAANADELRKFLDTQLGEIDNKETPEHAPAIILEMRERLRATRAVEFFGSIRSSEEPVQWDVTCHPYDRHLLVNAGPGAGKTFVLVGRIAHLIREQNIDPSRIVVLAFNRAVVFEIKRRIQTLFRSLGYATYASRLRVATFHAFAIKNLRIAGALPEGAEIDEALRVFSQRMTEDEAFRRDVAGDVRFILVDEFQDMSDSVYAVIQNLHLGSNRQAGVMVIGDDDQDILRWQRLGENNQNQFAQAYFERFRSDFGGDRLSEFTLQKNFRSCRAVVQSSQGLISRFFDGREGFYRLKTVALQPREGAVQGECDRCDWRNNNWDDAIGEVNGLLQRANGEANQSLAILCRTNAEVAHAWRSLSPVIPNLVAQGTATLKIADLRHVALWLDFVRDKMQSKDAVLTAELKEKLLAEFAQSHASIPEVKRPETSAVRLDQLWGLCCQEQPFPHLSSLLRFVGDLRSDDLTRLSGTVLNTSTTVVSTVHKVKGLEFDHVIILPSIASFPFRIRPGAAPDLAADAVEEARLLYVGMTRAKRRLTYFTGNREYSWAKRVPIAFNGEDANGHVLMGSMEDVFLGWSMLQTPFNPDPNQCQHYIETQVAVGDPITLGGHGGGAGCCLMHRRRNGQPLRSAIWQTRMVPVVRTRHCGSALL